MIWCYNDCENDVKTRFLKLTVVFIFLFTGHVYAFTTLEFPSADGLPVTADLYMVHGKDAPFILLFHRAGWSRGEYREIAPELNRGGFNCMAVDQRSGGEINGVKNITAMKAEKAGKATGFLDALQDMEAAVKFVRRKYASGPLILWGSSYSASLVIKMAGDKPDMADAVVSFSPGEYFTRFGKSPTFIADAAARIRCPVFITAAKTERGRWIRIFNRIMRTDVISYVPVVEGAHGSQALWKSTEGHEGYWKAVMGFLSRFNSK